MKPILRHLLLLAALITAVAGLAACGGGGDEASSDTSVNELLDKTFTGDKKVDSGKIDLSLKLDVSGGGSGVSGPVDVSLSGPFESQGATKLPKFDIDLAATGQGQNIKAGVTSTGAKGFVNFNGQEYAVSDEVFQQFKQGFEQAAAQNEKQGQQSLGDFGIDPREWLTNPKNAGEAQVGDTDVVRITGGVDVGKLLDDINEALPKIAQTTGQTQDLPSKLTDQQKQQVEQALKDVNVEIATGKDDYILRQMKIDLNAEDPEGSGGKLDMVFDLSLTELNEGQEFPEPENTKPFDQLLSQLGGLGGLGGVLGGSGAGAGAGGSGSGSGASGGASTEQLEEYSQCLEDAGSDTAKAQECASLLNG